MIQNIKVDIIYYKVPTDFEMEFNLSGCCRMRLLTDKASEKKLLIGQMSRAVSRSKVIIITGALFGEDGVTSICAKAIGRTLEKVDNKKFGIETAEDIRIIEKALPLVTKEGVFGGCIVEQGPQTLILLSENKDIRKKLMKTLIHPYMNEISVGGFKLEEDSELSEKTENSEPISNETSADAEAPKNGNTNINLADEIIGEDADYLEDSLNASIVAIEETLIDGEELILEPETLKRRDAKKITEASKAENLNIDLPTEMVGEDEEYLEASLNANQVAIEETLIDGEALSFEPETIKHKEAMKITRDYTLEDIDNSGVLAEEDEDYYILTEGITEKLTAHRLNLSIAIILLILVIIIGILAYYLVLTPLLNGGSVSEYFKTVMDFLFE